MDWRFWVLMYGGVTVNRRPVLDTGLGFLCERLGVKKPNPVSSTGRRKRFPQKPSKA